MSDRFDTKEERKEFTRKNPNKAVLRKRDGTTKIINKRSGKVEKEYNTSGNRVIRVNTERNSRGGSSKVFKEVNDQQAQAEQQRAVEQAKAEKEQEAIEQANIKAREEFVEATKDLNAQQLLEQYTINLKSDGSSYSFTRKESPSLPQVSSSKPFRGGVITSRNSQQQDPLLKGEGTPSFTNEIFIEPLPQNTPQIKSPEQIFFEGLGVSNEPIPSPRALNLLITERERIFKQGGVSTEEAGRRAVANLLSKDEDTARLLISGNVLDLTPDQRFEAEFNPTFQTFSLNNFKNILKFQEREFKKNKVSGTQAGVSLITGGTGSALGSVAASRIDSDTRKEFLRQGRSLFTAEEAGRQASYMALTGALNTVRNPVFGAGDVVDAGTAIPDIAGAILFPTSSRKATALLETLDVAVDIIPLSNLNFNFKASGTNIQLKNPNANSRIGGGGSNVASPTINTNAGLNTNTRLAASEFVNANNNFFGVDFNINNNFNTDFKVNKNFRNIQGNKNLNNNAELNLPVNKNGLINSNAEVNLDKNLIVNNNAEVNLNKNLTLNNNINKNANLNANANLNKNALINANLNQNINLNPNINFKNPRLPEGKFEAGAFRFRAGRTGSKFFKEFTSKNLEQGLSSSKQFVERSAAARLKVERLDGKQLTGLQASRIKGFLGTGFRQGRNTGEFIEKRSQRLNTRSEIADLKRFKKPFESSKAIRKMTSLIRDGMPLKKLRGLLK